MNAPMKVITPPLANTDQAQPLFEIIYADGRRVKLYADGKTEGLESDTIVINRAPAVFDAITALQNKVRAEVLEFIDKSTGRCGFPRHIP
jgi:hypothetical protein